MNFDRYTKKSLEAIQSAQNLALRNNHQQLEQVHILLALLQQSDGLAAQLLKKMGLSAESMEAAAMQQLRKLPAVTGAREADRFYISREVDSTFAAAEDTAKAMQDDYVSVEHLLLALVDTAKGAVKQLFDTYRLTREGLLSALQSVRGNQRITTDDPESTYEALEKMNF